jgi:hypothetical protein
VGAIETSRWAGIVAEVARLDGAVENILRRHVPDRDGFCCGPGCGRPGTGAPFVVWPCSTWSLAREAAASGTR